MVLHLLIQQQLKSTLDVLNWVKSLSLIVLLFNLTVYLEVVHVVGLLLVICRLLYSFSSAISGTGLEQFSVMFLLVLVQTLMNKWNLVLSKK